MTQSTSSTLTLELHVKQSMVEHARTDAPLETCAVLLGEDNRIDEYYEMENTDESEVHFTFDPKQQLEAMKTAREKNKEIIGIYHSHPAQDSRAYPSQEDQDHGWEEYVYFILSFTAGDGYDLNAFQFTNDTVIDRDFEVRDSGS